jgi:hypothetical protein
MLVSAGESGGDRSRSRDGMVEWLWVVALGGIGGMSDVAARFRRKQAKAPGMKSR